MLLSQDFGADRFVGPVEIGFWVIFFVGESIYRPRTFRFLRIVNRSYPYPCLLLEVSEDGFRKDFVMADVNTTTLWVSFGAWKRHQAAAATPASTSRTTHKFFSTRSLLGSTSMGEALSPCFLFDHHPCRLQQRERDQADQSGSGDEQRIADPPSEQNGKGRDTDRHGQPIADRNLPEQDAGAEDGPDCGRIGAFDEALNIRIAAMPRQDWRCHKHE